MWQKSVLKVVPVLTAAFAERKDGRALINIPKNACKFKKIFRLTAEKADL